MYIKRIALKGIKGFGDSVLNMCPDNASYPGWAVVTGDNGAGKTAFLRAIALALVGPDEVRTLVPDLRGWVMDGEKSGSISVEIKPHHDYDKTRRGGFPVQGTFWAEIEFTQDEGLLDVSSTDIFRKKRTGALNGPWQPATPGWFTLGYGPFRRLYGSSPDAQRLMMLPGRVPRFATLFKEDATLAEGEEWVRRLNYRKMEQREHERLTLESLLKLLSDNFLRQGIAVERIDSDGIWLKDPAGRIMPLTDMSEGYRSALAMLIDIFRHMSEAYGPEGLVAESADGGTYVDRPGVVLIDEVDAHLHPAWQREIGFWLKKHFPLVQFIVTTHSPLVCQAADNGRIYHLPTPGQGDPFIIQREEFEKIIAGRPDEILLTPAFGLAYTRSPRAVAARDRHARLTAKRIGKGLSEEEKKELSQLSLFATVDE